MTQVRVIGFIDVENKPRGPDWTTRVQPVDFLDVDYAKLSDPAWLAEYKSTVRAKGYYPSGKPGSKDGGVFDAVYIMLDGPLPPHAVGGPPIDNSKRQS